MQFKVPQNIDLEDKIVGPLTLIQFVYVLVGGLICYIIFQLLADYMVIVVIIDLPIALIALAMAFLKIQDQPLAHFIVAGIAYFQKPKIRFWRRQGQSPSVIYQAPVKSKSDLAPPPKKQIEKSDLEKLAHALDTRPMQESEQQNFGKITQNIEQVIRQTAPAEFNRTFDQKGGQSGTVAKPTANR